MRRLFPGAVVLAAVLVFAGQDAHAQHTRVTGKVTAHATGEAVEGAKLVFKHVDTGTTYEAESDKKGNYRLARVKYGNYDVVVSKEGYTTIKQTYQIEPRSSEATIINVDI